MTVTDDDAHSDGACAAVDSDDVLIAGVVARAFASGALYLSDAPVRVGFISSNDWYDELSDSEWAAFARLWRASQRAKK